MPAKKPEDQPEEESQPKWKIPPVKVLSDDCTVYIGREIVDGVITNAGKEYKTHVGEWVELFPARSLAEVMALSDVAKLAEEGSGALETLVWNCPRGLWLGTGQTTQACRCLNRTKTLAF